MLEALRSVDEAHPQQLLRELRRLRARFDRRVLGQLALIACARERIDEFAALEVLNALQAQAQAAREAAQQVEQSLSRVLALLDNVCSVCSRGTSVRRSCDLH